MADLHVWEDGDCVWVVAESAEDAAIAYAEFCGYDDPRGEIGKPGSDVVPENWSMVPDTTSMKVARDDDGKDVTTQTCAEWVQENGRGFLCTTER